MDQVHPQLFIGNYQDAQDTSTIKAHSIDTVINLSQRPTQPIDGLTTDHIPLHDSRQNTYEDFVQAVDRARDALENGEHVLIHCNMGVSRSVSVTATAMAATGEMNLRDAINTIEKHHPEANPHPHLVDQAKQYLSSQ